MIDLPASASVLHCGRYALDLSRPRVMGIVNLTPDSFSDGGRHATVDAGVAHARQLLAEGADILDLGGESTRPGAAEVAEADELARVLPVIEALRECGVPLSIDTAKPAVMRAALAAGADMINDIWGFRQPGALEAVAGSACGLCAMHMQGEPRTMQAAPEYDDVVEDVLRFLRDQAARLEAAGVARGRISLDPGFGFGKTVPQNYRLLRELDRIVALGYPVLIGVSRKSMIGAVTGKAVEDRMAGSVAAALSAVQRGARIVRVHDVAATVDALKIWGTVETVATP
ncbi:dihydropteroate synthase [Pigmentiphaga litoralis]|jgi:dihydropteroate synthase|uniref:dihydropteroate synthase n=1 Tax=Pigmentiphaga litoralis TaxID=516702 RepID=UPI0016789548|nr:dihydropteroate synthase [Pigmentiphaga litoralis]GGX35234.1 dihydropteroate synthase [Pigmentiphaga litoralis]